MSNLMPLKPRISEKAYGLSQSNNVYVFQVPGTANKLTVADAVSTQFGVTVTNVNITVVKGKVKTTYRKRGGRTTGSRADMKKAYVTLKDGQTIPIFATEDDKKAADKPDAPAKSKKATRSTK